MLVYDTDWKVEAWEGDTPLKVERVVAEDPFHTLAYDLAAFCKHGSAANGSMSNRTLHMFRVQTATATEPVTFRVTDSFGRVYIHTISRPHPYNLNMGDKEEKMYR